VDSVCSCERRRRNRVWNTLVAEDPENIPINTLLICVELGLRRRTHGQGGPFQGHSAGLDVTQQSSVVWQASKRRNMASPRFCCSLHKPLP